MCAKLYRNLGDAIKADQSKDCSEHKGEIAYDGGAGSCIPICADSMGRRKELCSTFLVVYKQKYLSKQQIELHIEQHSIYKYMQRGSHSF